MSLAEAHDWGNCDPLVMFQEDLAKAHVELIETCGAPVDEIFMGGLDLELSRIIPSCRGTFRNLTKETLELVESTVAKYFTRFSDLTPEQHYNLQGYAQGYVGKKLDSKSAVIENAED